MKIYASNVHCNLIKGGTLTSGLVGATLDIEFSEDFDNLGIIANFQAGDVERDVAIVPVGRAATVTIPHEVLANYGVPLVVGIYGCRTQTSGGVTTTVKATPTVYCLLTDEIKEGADPSGTSAAAATPSAIQQFLNIANSLKGISSITKTGTSGLVDTYTITYTNGTTSTFTVTNGVSSSDQWNSAAMTNWNLVQGWGCTLSQVSEYEFRIWGEQTSGYNRRLTLTTRRPRFLTLEETPEKTIPAGVYKITAKYNGEPSNKIYYTTGTMNDGIRLQDGATLTVTAPAAVYLLMPLNSYYGTQVNPSIFTFKLEGVEAVDNTARRKISEIRFPDTSLYARQINSIVKKILTKNTVMYRGNNAGMPMDVNEVGATYYYEQGRVLRSVEYSSVWRDGQDVWRNLTLETYLSAVANPTSVIYTKNYSDKLIANAHTWYGGVCSTFVHYINCIRLYHTCGYLYNSWERKTVNTFDDLEVGDIILSTGHVAVISQVYTDETGAFDSVDVAEQSGMFRVRNYKDLSVYMGTSYHFFKNPNINKVLPVLKEPKFNSNILFERGNNTYVTADEISDGMWFYIPNHSDIYIKKGSEQAVEIVVSQMPEKTVNGYTVHNLESCFDGVGDYQLYESASSYPCVIKVIDTGTATLNSGCDTLTISGWSNCVPYNWYLIVEKPIPAGQTKERGFRPSDDEHYCNWSPQVCGEIDVEEGESSVTVDIPTTYMVNGLSYKIWIEYDTGIGYKQEFSNLVQFNG